MQPARNRIEPGIYERVDANGVRLGLDIQYKDTGGRPRRRSVAGGLTEARDELARARTRRVKHAREPLDPRVTFAAVCDEFEAVHVASLRPNSQAVYRAALAHLRARFGEQRITQITRADVRRFVNDLAAEHKANTVRKYYAVMRAVYSFADSDLDIPVTFPKLKQGDLPDPADDQREKRILTDDELARIRAACDNPLELLYFATLAETGARASEVLGLDRPRVGEDTISFAHQLGAKDGNPAAPLKSRRGKRTIEVRRGLAAELRLRGGERIFAPLTLRAAHRAWKAILDRAALEGPQPVIHDLRHTHVSGLIADGWDVVEVAARVGDRVETVLREYAHEFDAKRRSAVRRAALEERYGDGMATGMATSTPSQTITHETGQARIHRVS